MLEYIFLVGDTATLSRFHLRTYVHIWQQNTYLQETVTGSYHTTTHQCTPKAGTSFRFRGESGMTPDGGSSAAKWLKDHQTVSPCSVARLYLASSPGLPRPKSQQSKAAILVWGVLGMRLGYTLVLGKVALGEMFLTLINSQNCMYIKQYKNIHSNIEM